MSSTAYVELPDDGFNVHDPEPIVEEETDFVEDDEGVELDEDEASFYHDLTERILLFTEYLCDVKIRPYQRPLAYRIVYSVLVGDGAEITVLWARQTGKSETIANVAAALMVLLPKLANSFPSLARFRKGFLVGVFAPIKEQAETIHKRVIDRLTSDHAAAILADPEIDESVKGSKGLFVQLRGGSSCRLHTANPKAKIESKTYHLMLVDEAQEADGFTITKSILPMGASVNGTLVMSGTANRTKSYFYRRIQFNKRRATRPRAPQDHFEVHYREVIKTEEYYARHIKSKKLMPGEDSDEFQMSYCVAPDTKILTADLRYICASSVRKGMKLVGFDEERPDKGKQRRFREAKVQSAKRIQRPCYTFTLSDGTTVTCSAEHRWLVSTAGGRTEWKMTKDLVYTDRIFKPFDVWGSQSGWDAGYLSAAFDGEGHLALDPDGQLVGITFAQKPNSMLTKVRTALAFHGFDFREYAYEANRGVVHLNIAGGRAQLARFLGEIRPQRLLDKFSVDMLRTISRRDGRGLVQAPPRVVDLRYVGVQDVIAIKTSTRTFIAEGLASHNCNKFLFDQGMFTTEESLLSMMDPTMETVKAWWTTPVVVGIDPARTNDSTVVTVVWVDWDYPDEFGFYEHRVLNWLEIHNRTWEEQYYKIVSFLSHYNVLTVGVDAQGMGSAVAERLAILLPRCQVKALGSSGREQNDRWVHFTKLMDRGLFIFPGHSKARRLRTWRRFWQQMIDAEKSFKGPYIKIAAPDEAEAHDDYVDSAALACSLTAEFEMPTVQAVANPFYS